MTVIVDVADMEARIQVLEAEVALVKATMARHSMLLLEVQADMRRGFAVVSDHLRDMAEILESIRPKATGAE